MKHRPALGTHGWFFEFAGDFVDIMLVFLNGAVSPRFPWERDLSLVSHDMLLERLLILGVCVVFPVAQAVYSRG
jgi:hypothetical protein